jgi:hypothetical protein
MSDKVSISITATDSASAVFGKVASSADKMDSSLSKSETTMQRFSRTGAAIGAALGAVSGIMADSARAAAEAEVSQERLRAAIEASGDTYEQYAEQLDAAGEAAVSMGFDDEEAADSIARLTASTGDAGEAIDQLGLIMDVARGRGISLADATRIVEAAELGRIGTLARMGIVLDENASKEEALAALQARYAGQAEAYAATTAGTLDRLRNQLENVQESIGEHTGAFQTLLVLMPGVSAAWTAATAALGGLSGMLGITTTNAAAFAKAWGKAGVLGAIAVGLYELDKMSQNNYMEDIFDDFDEGSDQLDAVLAQLAKNGEGSLLELGDATNAITDQMMRDFDRFSELSNIMGTDDVTQAQIDEFNLLADTFESLGLDIDNFSKLEGSVARILTNTGEGADLARSQLESLNEAFTSGRMDAADYWLNVDRIANSFEMYDRVATDAAGVTEKLGSSLHGTALQAMDAQVKLEAFQAQVLELARANLAQQFNEVTAAYTNTTNALSAGFRVIVQNTDAVGQQAQAVADWSEGLGLANNIAEDNVTIQTAILDIQRQQAPIIEELMSAQAEYWAGLADAPADQQRLALAYMDTATAAQALEIAQTAMAGAPGMENLIAGAIAANPLLEDILVDMGIISVGADGTVTVLTEGQSELTLLTETMRQLTAATWVATFGGDVSAAEAAYEEVMGDANAWENLNTVATVDADIGPAIEQITEAENRAITWDASTSTGKIDADNKDAVDDIGAAQSAANNYEKAYTASINAQDNASGTIRGVASALAAIDGSVATTYINIVEQKIGAAGLGGVMGYDSGGVVARMGEYGTERLTFPGGGIAFTSGDALYNVPRGTLVTPHTGLENTGGGGINLTVNIANANNTEQIVREIVPALQRALQTHQRGY